MVVMVGVSWGPSHCFIVGDSRLYLTLPLLAFTQGRLTLLMKVTSGGESGY